MKFIFIFVVTGLLSFNVRADVPQERQINQTAMRALIKSLETGNTKATAELFAYPFRQHKPLTDLKNAPDFIKVADLYFSPKRNQKIIGQLKHDIKLNNMRGTGDVRFRSGKIYEMTPISSAFNKALTEAVKLDQTKLHESAKGYDELLMDCTAGDLHTRIERFGQTYKAFLWDKEKRLAQRPKLFASASKEMQGSAGNVAFLFKGNGFKYQASPSDNVCSDETSDSAGHCRPSLAQEPLNTTEPLSLFLCD